MRRGDQITAQGEVRCDRPDHHAGDDDPREPLQAEAEVGDRIRHAGQLQEPGAHQMLTEALAVGNRPIVARCCPDLHTRRRPDSRVA
jgi:hypothetical protein